MDTCLCMAESLCNSPETTTKLLVSYTPIQNAFDVRIYIYIYIYCTPRKKEKNEKTLEIKQNKIKPNKGKILLLGIKAMSHLHSRFKSRDITLLTKVHISQKYGFSSSHVCM